MADPQGGAVTFGEEDLDQQSPVTFGESDISQEHPPAAKSAQRTSRAVTFGEHEIDKPVTFGEEEISGSDAQRFPYNDAAGKLHTASHSKSDDEVWQDVQADKAKSLPAKTTPLGGNPLGPGSVGYKAPAPAPPRKQLRFTDVWYPRVSTEAQAGAARATSPRATASKAAGMPLADVAGAPHDPQLDVPNEYNPKTGMPFKPSLVPALDAPGFVPGANLERNVESAATELSRFRENDKPAYGVDPNNRFGPPVRILPEAEEERQRRQRLDAAAGLVDNAMNVAGPVTAPMIAASGPLSVLKAGAGIAAGYGASEGGGALVHGKVSPEEEHAVRTALFFLPSLAGTVAGLKTTAGRTPEGGRAAGATILGGKAGVGVRSTPEAFEGAVKVGDTRIGARIPRTPGAPAEMPPAISENVPVSPSDTPGTQTELRTVPVPSGGSSSVNVSVPVERTITPQAINSAAKTHRDVVNAMVQANATETMAKNVVAGRPAVPPSPALPPTPSQQFGNKLDGSHIAAMAQVITSHPPAQRDALIDEAHSNLSRWISDNGKVFIDGKIHIVRNPDQADVLAAKLVNEAVAKHDKATAAAAQQPAQESTSAPAPSPAPVPAQPMQQFLRTTRPTPKPAAATPVSVGQQPTTQNLTGNEGSRGEVIPPSPGQSAAKPEARDVVATSEKQAPIIEGGKPEPSAPAVAQHITPPAEPSNTYDEAVRLTKEHGSASVSLLQRRLKIGYEEAAHLVNRMSDEGLVEAANGPRPRPVIEAPRVPEQFTEQDIQQHPERREPGNAALREKLKGMSPADKDRAIEEYHNRERTSAKTGLRNYLSFEESADTLGKTHPHVGYADVDDFKRANHVLGHYGVDKKILPMLGDVMRQAEAKENGAVHAFHRSGDEFLFRATDPAAVGRVIAHVNEALRTAKFEIEKPDGKIVTHDGIGLSHGTGESEQAAEYNADNGAHAGSKPSRKKSGQRTGSRDADAQSLVAHDTAGQQSHQDHTPERQGLLGDLDGSSEAAEGIARPAASLKPGEASVVPTAELHADPERFQYKGGTDEQGVTNALKDQQVYDQNKGGVLLVWKDPANGKVYVVNGHHRFELAKRAGEKTVLVRMIEAPNAEAAKVVGAETNISEGHGSLVDAARFFKAAGIKTPRDAMNRNLPLGQAKVTDGLAMAKLDNSILDKVESGDIPEGRAVAIGSVTESATQQDAVLQAIAKRESRSGKPVNNGEAESIARQVRDADSHIEQGQDLFGAFSHEQSLYGEQAEIDDYVLKQLSADKRTFGAVASKTRAETLGKVKDQQINQAENQRISEQAAQAAELYTKLVNSPGPLNDIRKNAAKNLASRYGKPQDVKAKAYAAVREQLQGSMLGEAPAYSLEPASKPSTPSTPVKGDTVTLKGGQVGTVKYVDPQMGIVRVHLASGETKTFPLGDVVSSGNRSGEAGFARMDVPSTLAKAALRRLLEPSDETKIARSVDDRLFDLEKHYEADVLRAKKLLESITTSPADQEAIYHHIEDPSSPITPSQQRFIDEYINPLNDASRQMRATLNGLGVPVGEAPPGFIHRIVQGRASQLGRATAGKKGTGKGNVLSKHASSLQRRQMFAAERTGNEQLPLSDEQRGPSRIVVHRGDGKITGFQDGEGFEFAKDKPGLNVGDTFKDKDGDEWTLTQATTKEIEQHTHLRYYKNALATSIADYLQLRRAERAVDALEAMKEDPEFQRMAFKSNHGDMPPEGWRPTTLPQFMGWYFEPRTAEVLERYARQMHGEPYAVLDRIGNFMTASLLLNPVRHIFNIGNHWLVERGVTGNFNPLAWPKAAQAGIRAIKAVTTQNEDFLDALDHGAPMMSHRQDLQQLHQKLYELLLEHLESDHTDREKIAQFVGLEPKNARDRGLLSTAARISGFRLLDNMRLYGQRTMWMSNDIFMLQSAYEKQLRDSNLSFKDAMAQVARHIPDYRVPDRVMNSKRLSDVMRHPLLTIFSRYHYGVWKSYGQMLRETFSPDSSLKDRARGIDHMLMLGLVTFVLYELWDHVLKSATGDKNARMVRSGASAVPSAIQQVVKGQREPGDLVTASLTPNPLLKTGAEIALNRDSYTGSKVYDEHDSGLNILSDIGMHAVAPLGPVQQVKNASHQDQPTRNFLFSQGGITFPKYESQTPAQKLMHDIMRDNLSITPELRRELQDRRDRIARGEMSQKERKSQMRKAALDEFQFYLPHLRYSEIKQVFHAATAEEKEIIRPIMLKKAVQIMRSNPFEGQREGALDAFNEK